MIALLPRNPIMTEPCAQASATLPDALHKAALSRDVVPKATAMWQTITTYSPYLTKIATRQPETFVACVEGLYTHIIAALDEEIAALQTLHAQNIWMKHARSIKERTALSIALADLSGAWTLEHVTRALTFFGEHMVRSALEWLLHEAVRRNEWQARSASSLQESSGISILGMGKLGAYELNYSSDIDIIVLFDPERTHYIGARNVQHFMNRIVQQLVHMLQERTEHGYVLRTDIRLRPDPMSTPPAVNVRAALHYYETVGQNWERAAMIKARAIAGDTGTSAAFLAELIPYIWRKNLDFNTIADIHSIMRQMHSNSLVPSHLLGHNIKTGIGGIRSIEFYVQTQQLVWGGRNVSLRVNGTLAATEALMRAALIDASTRDALHACYQYLRTLEHRLQMVEDAQTHSLPSTEEDYAAIARFMGYASAEDFTSTTRSVLEQVQHIYASAMVGSAPLSADGNLVFTGVENDEETLRTLHGMGYREAERISAIIQGWHRGHRRSTRSKRSRQLLTEMVPTLLSKLAEATNPDTAFFQFDDFLERLPSGVQIFSLIQARPEILGFITHILGSAVALGHTLSANPLLLDAMMEPEFFMKLPSKEHLQQELHLRLHGLQDMEQSMLALRVFQNEKRFQAGAHMLKSLAHPLDVSGFLSDLAEVVLQATLEAVSKAYISDECDMRSIPLAVLGFGKLGARDLTFDSDLDLVIVYDDRAHNDSNLRKHMQRISQRFITALTSMTREGRLYEIDTRLRPGGGDGPLAISLDSFDGYFSSHAWTFERMALTKARIIAHQGASITTPLTQCIHRHITAPHDPATIISDMIDMRERVAQEFGTRNPWHIKYVCGGMMDLEFITQTLVLIHAQRIPAVHQHNVLDVLQTMHAHMLIDATTHDALSHAYRVLAVCLSFQRLCVSGGVIQDAPSHGVFVMMANALKLASGDEVKDSLLHVQNCVGSAMQRLVTTANITANL